MPQTRETMNTVTTGARSFSPPPKNRHTDPAGGGGDWSSYNQHQEQPSHYRSNPRVHNSRAPNLHYAENEPLKKSASKMPVYAALTGVEDTSRQPNVSRLFDNVPMSHKSFLDPEYEAEMLRHKRDILQSVVDSHGTLSLFDLNPEPLLTLVDISSSVPILSYLDECRMLQYMCECLEAACMLKGRVTILQRPFNASNVLQASTPTSS